MSKVINNVATVPNKLWSYQRLSGSAFKASRREVPGSNASLVCRPSRLKFSIVFSETRVNTGQDPLEISLPSTKSTPPVGPGPTCGQLALFLQPNPNQLCTQTQRRLLLILSLLCIFFCKIPFNRSQGLTVIKIVVKAVQQHFLMNYVHPNYISILSYSKHLVYKVLCKFMQQKLKSTHPQNFGKMNSVKC